jgi:TetR/AcrR family transcriptional regulator, transcriptional repressor for nem operon
MTSADRSGEATAATRPGKRERLVAAACDVMYRQGAAAATLANVAEAADVPLGNVYYYFKTKEDLIGAAVRAHADELTSGVAALEQRHRTPRARLKALVGVLARHRDLIAKYGCPYGTLSSELCKRAGGSDRLAAPLMQIPLDWAEQQFRAMGRRDSHDLAVELIAAYQGAAVLSSSLGRPEVMARLTRRLDKWIDTLDAHESR